MWHVCRSPNWTIACRSRFKLAGEGTEELIWWRLTDGGELYLAIH